MKLSLPPPSTFLGYICGILAAIFWGTDTVIMRYLMGSKVLGAIDLGFSRFLIGAVILTMISIILSFFSKTHFTARFPYCRFFWIATVSLVINVIFFQFGLQYTIASDAILIETLAPVVILILVAVFLPQRIQHFSRKTGLLRKILFLFLAGSIGSSLLLINDPKNLLIQSGFKLRGDIIEFGAMFCFALFILTNHEFQRKNSNIPPLRTMSHIFFFGSILFAPFVHYYLLPDISSINWILILTVGIMTPLAYAFWQIATVYLDILPLAILFSLSSVFTVAFESILFELDVSIKLLLGAIFILGTSIITEIINSKYKILAEKNAAQT